VGIGVWPNREDMMREYMNESGNGTSAFFLGVACGAAVGAAVALLMAPKAGVELRRDLASQADDLKRAAADKYDEAMGHVSRIVEKGRRVAREGQDAVRQAANEFADAGTSQSFKS
jgi:gas vesicle protein